MRYILFSIVLLTSCTEKVVVIPDFVAPDSDRVILVEEFTGASCPNCPAGADAIEGLLIRYPDNVVVIGLHSDFLAKPVKTEDLDLRTQEANDIETYLGGWFAKPEAAINRKKFSGQPNIRVFGSVDKWDGFVQKELETFATIGLKIESDYDAITRTVNFKVIAEAKEKLTGDHRINVIITESNIITAQIDVKNTIDKYNQKHVLRKALTSIEGSSWFGDLDANLIRERSYSFTLPDEEDKGWWLPENCHIVAFISNGSTKEVIQAAEVDVIE